MVEGWLLALPIGYVVTTEPLGREHVAQDIEATMWEGWFIHNDSMACEGRGKIMEYDWGDGRD